MSATQGIRGPASYEPGGQCLEQLAGCLARLGRREQLEGLMQQADGRSAHAPIHHALALCCAREHRWLEAIGHLRQVLSTAPGHGGARGLGQRLSLHVAKLGLQAGDWNGVSEALGLALELGPLPDVFARQLAGFRSLLAICQIKAGQRQQAAQLLVQQLREEPGNHRLIHTLALMYYWWAREEEKQDPEGASSLWECVIAYWTVLLNLDAFWAEWRDLRAPVWGAPASADNLQGLRERLNQQLTAIFQNLASGYREAGRTTEANRHEEHLAALELENRSAEWWRRAISIKAPEPTSPSASPSAARLLGLPGGVLFFRQVGLLEDVLAHAERLGGDRANTECVVRLRICFSAAGLGRILIALEERKNSTLAIEMLRRLPEGVRDLVETRYLLVMGLSAEAARAAEHGEYGSALGQWQDVNDRLAKVIAKLNPDSIFRDLLEKLKGDIAASVESTVQKEGVRLRAKGKLDEAVALLERIYSNFPQPGIREHLCVFYCDRASEFMAARRFGEARAQFSRALKLNPSHQRARTGMGTAYNNEATEQKSPETAIPLFEKAREYDPESTIVRENLARAYNQKAVELINSTSPRSSLGPFDEAIEYLKKAVRLANPNLKEEAIQALIDQDAVEVIAEMTKDMPDDVYKHALNHLAQAAGLRRRHKAGKLTSDAIDMVNALGPYDRYSGGSVCDRAIKMLIDAARILKPSIPEQILKMLEYTDADTAGSLLRSVDDEQLRHILTNLSAAYRARRAFRNY